MTGTDHPPRHMLPAPVARRALATGALALVAIAAPAAVVSGTAGGNGLTATLPPRDATQIALVHTLQPVRSQSSGLATIAKVTTPPPAPPAPVVAAPPPPPPPPPPPAPPPPPPVVEPVATGGGYNDPNNPAAWDRLAQCEAGGHWGTNTGNGYYGGIQFSLGSWQAVGGTGYPHEASRETQIAMGQRLWNQGGWRHWPACSSQLGYR